MPDPMEQIIANHLLGNTDRETTDRHADCNLAARTRISCRCGAILDQETVVVLKRNGDRYLYACCPDCFPIVEEALPELAGQVGGTIYAVTWNETKEYSDEN